MAEDAKGLIEVATRRFKTGHQLGLMRANVELAGRLADAAALPSPLLAAAREALASAEARLGYSVDHTALIKWLETLTPSEPAKPVSDETSGPA